MSRFLVAVCCVLTTAPALAADYTVAPVAPVPQFVVAASNPEGDLVGNVAGSGEIGVVHDGNVQFINPGLGPWVTPTGIDSHGDFVFETLGSAGPAYLYSNGQASELSSFDNVPNVEPFITPDGRIFANIDDGTKTIGSVMYVNGEPQLVSSTDVVSTINSRGDVLFAGLQGKDAFILHPDGSRQNVQLPAGYTSFQFNSLNSDGSITAQGFAPGQYVPAALILHPDGSSTLTNPSPGTNVILENANSSGTYFGILRSVGQPVLYRDGAFDFITTDDPQIDFVGGTIFDDGSIVATGNTSAGEQSYLLTPARNDNLPEPASLALLPLALAALHFRSRLVRN